ncbi:hypothetical protein A2U01_0034906, partial [Trifolium medium]|nr:hypothetical protein [Trifolium medium]
MKVRIRMELALSGCWVEVCFAAAVLLRVVRDPAIGVVGVQEKM